MPSQARTQNDKNGISVDDRVHSANETLGSANQLFDNSVLTYPEVMQRLRIPRRTLERLVSKDQIPHRRFGRNVRFYWPELVEWLKGAYGK